MTRNDILWAFQIIIFACIGTSVIGMFFSALFALMFAGIPITDYLYELLVPESISEYSTVGSIIYMGLFGGYLGLWVGAFGTLFLFARVYFDI